MDNRVPLVLALLAALGMKFFLFDFMIVEGRSMLPALESGSFVLINRAAYGLRIPGAGKYVLRWRKPRIGDVVVLKTPAGTLAVKRCVQETGGRFMVLGDNDLESFDSRSYGPVGADSIIGQVVGVK